MPEFDYSAYLKQMNVRRGAIVDVVTDLRNIALFCMKRKLKFDADKLLDAICAVVGSSGTVLVRTFNWDFCKGLPFDIRQSKSRVGALGNLALHRKDFIRTRHPIYSWMVWGNYQRELCDMDYMSAFGEDSVFAWEAEHDSYILDMGQPDVPGLTIKHYIEEKNKAPFRYHKNFTGDYIDYDGRCSRKTYSMYVHALEDKYEFNIHAYDKIFEEKGIKKETDYNGLGISSYHLPSVCQCLEDDFINHFPGKGHAGHYGGYSLCLFKEVDDILKQKDLSLAHSKKMEIAQAIMEAFQIRIEPEMMGTELLDSLEAIVTLVGMKRGEENA